MADAPADPADTLCGTARHELWSMPYTPPEVLLQHVGPLWRAFLAVEAERDRLAAQLAAVRAERDTLRGALLWVRSAGSRSGTNLNAWNEAFDVIDAALAASPSTPEETP